MNPSQMETCMGAAVASECSGIPGPGTTSEGEHCLEGDLGSQRRLLKPWQVVQWCGDACLSL